MNDLTEILKYITPMLVLGATFYFLIEKFFEQQNKKMLHEFKLNDRDILTPQRLQAYERMTLFVERIRLTNLIMRTQLTNTTDAYEYALIKQIQEEFSHNLSQQLYIDPETWKAILSTKNTTQNTIKDVKNSLENENNTEQFRHLLIQKSNELNGINDSLLLKFQSDILNLS